MRKQFLILLLAAGMALTSCGEDSPAPETAPETVAEPADPADAFAYVGSNYTVTDSGASASITSPDSFTEILSGAFYEDPVLDGDFAAELHVTLDSVKSNAGLLFRAEKSDSFDGFEGYALTLRDKRVYLYHISGTSSAIR